MNTRSLSGLCRLFLLGSLWSERGLDSEENGTILTGVKNILAGSVGCRHPIASSEVKGGRWKAFQILISVLLHC